MAQAANREDDTAAEDSAKKSKKKLQSDSMSLKTEEVIQMSWRCEKLGRGGLGSAKEKRGLLPFFPIVTIPFFNPPSFPFFRPSFLPFVSYFYSSCLPPSPPSFLFFSF